MAEGMVWIRFYYIFLDRIYRMYKIFSRFPEETVKTASALRRKAINTITPQYIKLHRASYG